MKNKKAPNQFVTTESTDTLKKGIDDIEVQAYILLKKLSAPPSLAGYSYIIKAIEICYEDRTMLDSITKRLYPRLAEEFNSTPSRVERAIRHCVTRMIERADFRNLELVFGLDKTGGSIPNKEFFSRILEYMKYHRVKEESNHLYS